MSTGQSDGSQQLPHLLTEALRRRFEDVCCCYWRDLPGIPMPINPATHGINCAAHDLEADYQEHMHAMDLFVDPAVATPPSTPGPTRSRGTDQPRSGSSKRARKEPRTSPPAVRRPLARPRPGGARAAPAAESARGGRAAVFGTARRRTALGPRDCACTLPPSEEREDAVGDGRDGLSPAKSKARRPHPAATPGPGAYETESGARLVSRSPPKTVFNRAARQSSPRTLQMRTPGPGAYNPPADALPAARRRVATPSLGGSRSPRLLPFECIVVRRSPGSAAQRAVAVGGGSSPGPGEYDVATPPPASRGGSFSKARVDAGAKAAAATPGPAHYAATTGKEVAAGRGAFIGTSHRPPLSLGEADAPGPGAYDAAPVQSPGRRTSFTFRTPEKVELLPGPGSYDVSSPPGQRRITGVVMGSSPRDAAASADPGPGPGLYVNADYCSDQQRSAAHSFGTAPRHLNEVSRDPGAGPGTYEAATDIRGPSYSFPRAGRPSPVADPELHPGPGAYDTDLTRSVSYAQSSPGWGTSPRFDETHEREAGATPGPGAYDADRLYQAPRGGAVLGSAPRLPAPSADGAGPATYDVPPPPSGPALSMSFRHYSKAAADPGPGPGAYEPQVPPAERHVRLDTTSPRFTASPPAGAGPGPGPGYYLGPAPELPSSRTPGTVVGRAPRWPPCDEEVPGPGTYDADMRPSSGSPVFLTEPRFAADGSGGAAPGPGTYHDPAADGREWLRRGVSVPQARRLPEPHAETPGPAAYDLERATAPQGPQIVLGTAPQRPLHSGSSATGPETGPGSYGIPVVRDTAAWTVPKAAREGSQTGTSAALGPGAYDPTDGVRTRRPAGVVLGTARRDTPTSMPPAAGADAPGPGAYMPQRLSDGRVLWRSLDPAGSSKEGFGTTACRPAPSSGQPGQEAPGPGAYVTAMDWRLHPARPAVVFGTAPRSEDAEAESPGPAAYDVPPPAAHGAPSFPRAPRTSGERGTENGPGPGAYEAPLPSPAELHFSTARRFADEAAVDIPGPGQYAAAAQALQHTAGPSFSFGTAPRSAEATTSTDPGPGSYAVSPLAATHSAPSLATSAARIEGVPAEALNRPGPGSYDPRSPHWDGGAAYSFGSSPTGNDALPSGGAGAPGPGAYELQAPGPTSQSYSFSQAPRRSSGTGDCPSDVPGPGQYDVAMPVSGPQVRFGTASTARGPSSADSLGLGPGPGAYELQMLDPADHLHRGVPLSTAPAHPPWPEVLSGAASPGPGSYMVGYGDGAARAPVFATAPRFPSSGAEQEASGPGPGAYDAAVRSQPAGPSFPTAPRLEDVTCGEGGPGPGAYNIETQPWPALGAPLDGVAFASTAPRFAPTAAVDTPGPGSYSCEGPAGGPATEFGSAERFPTPLTDDVPGPGSYDVLPPLGAGAPAAFLSGRGDGFDAATAPAEGPGPGTYAPGGGIGLAGNAPSFSITGKPYDPQPSVPVPGPGAYYVLPVPGEGAPGYRFGLAPREAASAGGDTLTLGPGAYHSAPLGTSSGGFHFGTNPRDAPDSTTACYPGPGTYHNWPLSTGTGWSMGTSSRGEPTSLAAPCSAAEVLEQLRAAGYPVKSLA